MSKLKVEILVPDWVNWMTVDGDGTVWGWSDEPVPRQYTWDTDSGLSQEDILYHVAPPKNWKDELYTWS